VGVIETYHLALGSTPLFLEHDRGAQLTAKAAHAQDDPSRKLTIAASRPWFVVEVVHKGSVARP
jgi:hypothetical protein